LFLPGTHFSFPFKYKDNLLKKEKKEKSKQTKGNKQRGQAETRERDVSP
jgi:hypothetical protein